MIFTHASRSDLKLKDQWKIKPFKHTAESRYSTRMTSCVRADTRSHFYTHPGMSEGVTQNRIVLDTAHSVHSDHSVGGASPNTAGC